MEYLDIFDENMNLIGQAEREQAHAEGLIHQVVHVWIVSEIGGAPAFVFQQRAFDKKDFPGLYDIAVGGHMDAGEAPAAAALREMREEIGLHLAEKDLAYLGCVRDDLTVGGFINREFAHVYLVEQAPISFEPGPEVARMVWVPVWEYQRKMAGAAEISAYTQKDEKITIADGEWCLHPGGEDRVVLGQILKNRERKIQA